MTKNCLIRLIVLLSLVLGGYLLWNQLPEHKKTFWKTFFRQIPDLPGRFMA